VSVPIGCWASGCWASAFEAASTATGAAKPAARPQAKIAFDAKSLGIRSVRSRQYLLAEPDPRASDSHVDRCPAPRNNWVRPRTGPGFRRWCRRLPRRLPTRRGPPCCIRHTRRVRCLRECSVPVPAPTNIRSCWAAAGGARAFGGDWPRAAMWKW
jgi:hypothetical protein